MQLRSFRSPESSSPSHAPSVSSEPRRLVVIPGDRVDDIRSSVAVRSALKRVLDIALACALLFIFAPVMLLAMFAMRISSRGSSIFVHRRIGQGERSFPLYKVRSMADGASGSPPSSEPTNERPVFLKVDEDPRITRVGRFLRRASIDELPQLFNVLRGDMSLVGPRPLVKQEVERLPSLVRFRRASVKPGITGLWQINGRNDCPDHERLRLDMEYVERWSLRLDLEILLRTIPAVLTCRGAK